MKEDKIKVLFPEGVETITISKNVYDRLYGEMTYQNILLQERIDKALDYIKKIYDWNYETIENSEGDIIDIGYAMPALEDIAKILKGDK